MGPGTCPDALCKAELSPGQGEAACVFTVRKGGAVLKSALLQPTSEPLLYTPLWLKGQAGAWGIETLEESCLASSLPQAYDL